MNIDIKKASGCDNIPGKILQSGSQWVNNSADLFD